MNSNYILLNYQTNWSDLQTNFLASLKYPVWPWLFDTGSRPPEPGWELSWMQGWDGDRECRWLYTGDPRWVIACLSPAQAAPCLVFLWLLGWLNTWAFLTWLHHPDLALALTRLLFSDCFKRNLPPGPFLSADTAAAQRWKLPLRRWRRCLLGAQTLEKSDGGCLTAPSQAEQPPLLLPMPQESPWSALPWSAFPNTHRDSHPGPTPEEELTEPRQLASAWGIILPLVNLHLREDTFPDPACSQDPGHARAGSEAS